MKVLLLNGSPRSKGCTYTGLTEIASELQAAGIETEIVHIGNKPIIGCTACGGCRKTKRCVFKDDGVNDFLDRVEGADGFVFGAPVHFAGMSGAMKSFMDRTFYAHSAAFRGKPAAIMASVRRGGSSSTLDGLIKYPTYGEMLLVSGRYWNMIHGNTPEEVQQDLEGMQNLRFVGRNLAWVLRLIEAGAAAGIEMPAYEAKTWTNFIR
ncbi:MAG: flavodoxin family protein [Turicibacter sp.]|nr:flavodoxin family protein [Turicibacter sp.]